MVQVPDKRKTQNEHDLPDLQYKQAGTSPGDTAIKGSIPKTGFIYPGNGGSQGNTPRHGFTGNVRNATA